MAEYRLAAELLGVWRFCGTDGRSSATLFSIAFRFRCGLTNMISAVAAYSTGEALGCSHWLGREVQLTDDVCCTTASTANKVAPTWEHDRSSPAMHVQWPVTIVPSSAMTIHGRKGLSETACECRTYETHIHRYTKGRFTGLYSIAVDSSLLLYCKYTHPGKTYRTVGKYYTDTLMSLISW